MAVRDLLPVLSVVCCCVVVSAAPWRNYEVRQSQVCGDKLADMLSLICSGRGYNFAFKPEGSNARRFRRGIVEECCHRSCTPALLELYCRADTADPPSNVQIRKRSDSGTESSEQSTQVTSSTTSPKPIQYNIPVTRDTTRDNAPTTPVKEGETLYNIINLLSSSEHSTHKHSTKALASKPNPNDTTEEDLSASHNALRHHRNHHHIRRKQHGRKTSVKAKKDKMNRTGSEKTFEIGTVKPYFAGRPFASYRSSFTRASLS